MKVDALTQSLKPWQKTARVGCRECDGPSVYFVLARVGELRIRADGAAATISTPELMVTHACEEHREQIANDYLERWGWVDTSPMATSWRYWLASLYWVPYNRLRDLRARRHLRSGER